MKPLTTITIVLSIMLLSVQLQAQQYCFRASSSKAEIGVGAGFSNYVGELSHRYDISGFEISTFHPAAELFYRHTPHKFISLKASLAYTRISGDDAKLNTLNSSDPNWDRKIRNLSFRSDLVQLNLMAEWNVIGFMPASYDMKFSPILTAGIALLHHDPKAKYNGEWIKLQPLGTEGQGIVSGSSKYSPVQVVIPIGLGFKSNLPGKFVLGVNYTYNISFTDYLDDVSTVYPDPQNFYSHYDSETAELAAALSNRSAEVYTDGVNSSLTGPGSKRGNPDTKDAYGVFTVSISKAIGGCAKPKGAKKSFKGNYFR